MIISLPKVNSRMEIVDPLFPGITSLFQRKGKKEFGLKTGKRPTFNVKGSQETCRNLSHHDRSVGADAPSTQSKQGNPFILHQERWLIE